ncbi:MAG: 3-hydroxyacyl-CoA dehydrogenase family protein [Chloroflexi bacterium]|nr:3-hydroxyacyl-CoA dehydrogenase family protein [Chloroflexota bacterium]
MALPARVFVAGSGVMGAGIAQSVAAAGIPVILYGRRDETLERAGESIDRALTRLVKTEKLEQNEAVEIRERIRRTSDIHEAARAEYVIETITERRDDKLALLSELDLICSPNAIFASNTSQFPITQLARARAAPRRDRVIGTHFMNPAPVMRLVEVARGVATSDETLATTVELIEYLGKEPIVCRDSQGFVTSRVLAAALQEGIRCYEEGLASAEDVDRMCRLAFNWPLGPLALADFAGLDTLLNIWDSMAESYGDRLKPPQSLRLLVAAEMLGRKSGRGYRDWTQKR